MPGKKNLTVKEKEAIMRGIQRGKGIFELADQFNVTPDTIRRVVKNFKKRGHHFAGKKSGRPRITNEKQDKIIEKLAKSNPRQNSVVLCNKIKQDYQIKCCPKTVKRRLRDKGLYARKPARKPLISEKNRRLRLEFAKKYVNKPMVFWEKVLWSDESKYNLFGNDSRGVVMRPNGQRFNPKYQTPTVKHGGGNVMVWGCFSRDGVGPLIRIEDTMDRFVYKDILENHMLPHARHYMARGWIFQDDNDPKHKSKYVMEYEKSKKINRLDFPAQSADLNPIEHLWDELERRVEGRKPSNKNVLFEMLKTEWENIPIDTLIKLVDSMPNRLTEVIKNNGYATRY